MCGSFDLSLCNSSGSKACTLCGPAMSLQASNLSPQRPDFNLVSQQFLPETIIQVSFIPNLSSLRKTWFQTDLSLGMVEMKFKDCWPHTFATRQKTLAKKTAWLGRLQWGRKGQFFLPEATYQNAWHLQEQPLGHSKRCFLHTPGDGMLNLCVADWTECPQDMLWKCEFPMYQGTQPQDAGQLGVHHH